MADSGPKSDVPPIASKRPNLAATGPAALGDRYVEADIFAGIVLGRLSTQSSRCVVGLSVPVDPGGPGNPRHDPFMRSGREYATQLIRKRNPAWRRQMRRREFIALGGTAVMWPLALRAQQVGRVHRIGILETIPATENAANLDALRKGLRDLGYIEGQNLLFEYQSADGRAERFPALASELVRLKVDLIVTRGTPAAQAAKDATGTIPVVMAAMGAPLVVVASIAHPGGNMTGLITFSTDLTAKRIDLIKGLVPTLARVALLHNMGNPVGPPEWEETKMAARALSLQAELFDVRRQDDIGRAFEAAVRQHVDALLVGIDGLTQTFQRTIVDLAARNGLPAIYPARDFVEVGGLMAYAVNYPDLYFRAAGFVDKILKGEKPADLPMEQPTKFELVINLKTVKALGLTIPPMLLARADEVIE
jgi:putative tryptophan/tyrosine transport system substrate-binding protein